jgi:beta-N-acetylhexosaminidase
MRNLLTFLRRQSQYTLPLIFTPLIIFFCINLSPKSTPEEELQVNNMLRLYDSTTKLVINKLNEMTLREKIGQMLVSSTLGEDYVENSNESKRLKKLCEQTEVGGFIFFKGTSTGYANLSNKLQSLSKTPLLISSDFERGPGMRVIDCTVFPNNMAIGATRNSELAYNMGYLIAKESKALGVNQDYAPVCDVNNNPNNPIINVRSFGEDPDLVSTMSEAEIRGLQDGKVIATAKHFPGHGDTEIDSHNDLPVLNFSMDRLSKLELIPFKNAIKHDVMSVMVAHLSFPELENKPNVPASLSKNVVEGLLIDKLGFNGLIVTDALNMKGITKYFTTEQVAVMCVEAGIDLILMPTNEDQSLNAIEDAINNGIITEERINRSVEKILKAKEWVGLFDNKYVDVNQLESKIKTQEAMNLSQQIADESITLVKDEMNYVPLSVNSKDRRMLIFNLSAVDDEINSSYFNSKMKDFFPNKRILEVNSEINPELIDDYLKMASDYDAVIVAIYAKVRHGSGTISILPSQTKLINSFVDNKNKLIVISFGNPYLLNEFPTVPNYICAFGDADVSINAALKAITGGIHFKGKLPISISDEYKFGIGITK